MSTHIQAYQDVGGSKLFLNLATKYDRLFQLLRTSWSLKPN
jgi:hypothetical protein